MGKNRIVQGLWRLTRRRSSEGGVAMDAPPDAEASNGIGARMVASIIGT